MERVMAVLLLDPLLLGLLLVLAGYCGAVWRGWFVRWFGRPDWWTAVAWPLPALLVIVPVVGGGVLGLLGLAGIELGDGGAGDAAVYAATYLVPLIGLTLWPPRWLLPPWARQRLTALPPVAPGAPTGGMPAAHGRRGHGSRASWVWRVDAVAGSVWVEGGCLRFRALHTLEGPDDAVHGPDHAGDGPDDAVHGPDHAGDGPDHAGVPTDLDDEAIAELRFSTEGELRLEPPRGGLWSRARLDVELAEVDRCHVRGRRPWRRDGLLTIEVAGRRSLHLWVDDARTLASRSRSSLR
jgi:hypothetical protein